MSGAASAAAAMRGIGLSSSSSSSSSGSSSSGSDRSDEYDDENKDADGSKEEEEAEDDEDIQVPTPPKHACRPDSCPECKPLIIYLPDELFSDFDDELSDHASDDEDDDDDSEEARQRQKAAAASALPPGRNGKVKPIDDPELERLLRSIEYRYEPDQPDTLDRVIALFNSGKLLGPEGEAQMKRLRAQQRRRRRRRLRRDLDPGKYAGRRRLHGMAECFCGLGRLMLERSAGGGGGGGGGNGLTLLSKSAAEVEAVAAAVVAAANGGAVSPTSDIGDDADDDEAEEADDDDNDQHSTAPAKPHSAGGEIRIEITDETLAEMGRLCPEAEEHFRRVLLGGATRRRSSVVPFCLAPAGSPEYLRQRWQRHCVRQSRWLRPRWERRLAELVGELLEGRLAGALYEPVWCSRVTNLLASDLLELVMHAVGDEFKIVGLLSIGSVTELDDVSMATRSAHFDGIDSSKAFHYQNESVYAVFTCHLFQRLDRQLDDAPLSDSDDDKGKCEGSHDQHYDGKVDNGGREDEEATGAGASAALLTVTTAVTATVSAPQQLRRQKKQRKRQRQQQREHKREQHQEQLQPPIPAAAATTAATTTAAAATTTAAEAATTAATAATTAAATTAAATTAAAAAASTTTKAD